MILVDFLFALLVAVAIGGILSALSDQREIKAVTIMTIPKG